MILAIVSAIAYILGRRCALRKLVEIVRFELTTSCLQSRRSTN